MEYKNTPHHGERDTDINNIPYMFSVDPERKYTMETVPVRKIFPTHRQNHASQNSQILSFKTTIFPF